MKEHLKKILIFDPLSVDGLSGYTSGLCNGLVDNHCAVRLLSNKKYAFKSNKYEISRVFFCVSQNLKKSKFRTYLKGIEYICNWCYVLTILKKFKPDVFHVIWLLNYKVDYLFLSILKLAYPNLLLVYTAHNIFPHNEGKKQKKILKKLYSVFHRIILHGSELINKFEVEFPTISQEKIFLSQHGVKDSNRDYKIQNVSSFLLLDDQNTTNTKYLVFLGLLNYNKGVDVLYQCWKCMEKPKDVKLIIAGQLNPRYNELIRLEEEIQKDTSVIYYPKYLSNDEVNYIFDRSDCLILPYRNGSVSGVLFDAAAFSKPVLSTDFGAIKEYIINGETGIVVERTSYGIKSGLRSLIDIPKSKLSELGKKNKQYITITFSWKEITLKMINDCY